MEPNAYGYYKSALKLKLPVSRMDVVFGFKLTLGKQNYHFSYCNTPINSGVSAMISLNKGMCNNLLRSEGIPVPKAAMLDYKTFSLDKLITVTKHLKFPVVVKPLMWSFWGKDVICNIPNIQKLFEESERLIQHHEWLYIEEFYSNLQSYRVLVFKNKILDIIARDPANVTGDGKKTIERLVADENARRAKKATFIGQINFDTESSYCLQDQKLTKHSIPKKGQVVFIGHTSNASRGGTIRSVPNEMCNENKKLFMKIRKTLNMDLTGIDVECKSLMEPIQDSGGVIIEVNHNPSIRIHEEGLGGKVALVTMPIMRSFIYKHPISYFLSLFRFKAFTLCFLSVCVAMAVGFWMAYG